MPRERSFRAAFPFARLTSCLLSFLPPSLALSQGPDAPLTYVYGVEAACGAAPRDVIDAFVEGVRVLEEVCDAQNEAARAAGRPACPPSTCVSVFEPGGSEPPRLEVEITWTNNTSSSTSGTPASSYVSSGAKMGSGTISGGSFGGPTNGSSSQEGVVVRVKLSAALGRMPDKLTCVNPMSQVTRDGLLNTVVALAAKGPTCAW